MDSPLQSQFTHPSDDILALQGLISWNCHRFHESKQTSLFSLILWFCSNQYYPADSRILPLDLTTNDFKLFMNKLKRQPMEWEKIFANHI